MLQTGPLALSQHHKDRPVNYAQLCWPRSILLEGPKQNSVKKKHDREKNELGMNLALPLAYACLKSDKHHRQKRIRFIMGIICLEYHLPFVERAPCSC